LPQLCDSPQFRYDLTNLHFIDRVKLIKAFLSAAGWQLGA
jgi:hypothetical protein